MTDKNRFLWLGGKVIHIDDATINVLSPTAQFGANVFEGIRCYWNEEQEQLYAFRLPEHYKRLQDSMKMFRMKSKYSSEELKEALVQVIEANGYKEDLAVRQTVFIDGFGSWNSTEPVNMFVAPIPKSRSPHPSKSGLKCCISSWERISDKNISPKVKVGANYINSRMAQMEAIENGYDSALLMNNQGKVAEGPGSCLFIVRDDVLITPPITASILESITRLTIIELAKNELDMKVVERDIDRTELYMCDEAFLCGSAIEIMPVLSVDRLSIGNEMPGSVTEAIKEIYLKVVSGELETYSKWLTPIY